MSKLIKILNSIYKFILMHHENMVLKKENEKLKAEVESLRKLFERVMSKKFTDKKTAK